MPRRSLASAILAAALSLPAVALADVPPADGGGSGGASVDLSCTPTSQNTAGSTCAQCTASADDAACQTELGSEYSFVCNHSATVQVWCTGPDRNISPDPGCALGSSPLPAGPAFAVVMALLGLAAWSRRRAR
jgi:hypothetical protein